MTALRNQSKREFQTWSKTMWRPSSSAWERPRSEGKCSLKPTTISESSATRALTMSVTSVSKEANNFSSIPSSNRTSHNWQSKTTVGPLSWSANHNQTSPTNYFTERVSFACNIFTTWFGKIKHPSLTSKLTTSLSVHIITSTNRISSPKVKIKIPTSTKANATIGDIRSRAGSIISIRIRGTTTLLATSKMDPPAWWQTMYFNRIMRSMWR